MSHGLHIRWALLILAAGLAGCRQAGDPGPGSGDTVVPALVLVGAEVPGIGEGLSYRGVPRGASITLRFNAALDRESLPGGLRLSGSAGSPLPYSVSFSRGDSAVTLHPQDSLRPLEAYALTGSAALSSTQGGHLSAALRLDLRAAIDSADKFPRIPDSALLTRVQHRTFAYFWDMAHPVSGMARERTGSGDLCTTGGTGFGLMGLLVGIHRGFITRTEGLARVQRIVGFLKTRCSRYHGAFAHWVNGATGATIPFSPQDDGADLVETAYLMQGLLCVRQFFNGSDAAETALRADINALWTAVDWNWFHRDGQQQLYWHWSPVDGWALNLPVKGWNEALITYVLAASAPVDPLPPSVYHQGWAGQGSMANGKIFFGIPLPLGPDYGGPMFFAHYSFLGLDPRGLEDRYAHYWTQDSAQAAIQYRYAIANPGAHYGYSDSCWGLTASDDKDQGYAVHSPTADNGVLSPTAALSSLPFTPQASMAALRFMYYQLGDRLWGPYGFRDAFRLDDGWFADAYLAIDQGPQLVMIENYRSGLCWTLFMSCPEIRQGLAALDFRGPGIP